jgi:LysR family transcriptional regulator, transcriptional activator of nhaA
MRHLNYNHLLYFWTVAREGSITRASQSLHLTPQTISGQLKQLELSVGSPLFDKVGRRLVLSETGNVVRQYADEIFSLGAELTQRMKSQQPGVPRAFHVGVVNSMAKLIAYRILKPALDPTNDARVACQEGKLQGLLGDLAIHRLDLVISDQPIPAGLSVKAYNHVLGESDISLFAHRRNARRYARGFPGCLKDAPMLLPSENSALRRRLDAWFDQIGLQPKIVAEFDDSALMKAFAQAGTGVFPAPSAIAEHVSAMYSAQEIGVATGVKETYYAISPERRIKHPAVLQVTESARLNLFGEAPETD